MDSPRIVRIMAQDSEGVTYEWRTVVVNNDAATARLYRDAEDAGMYAVVTTPDDLGSTLTSLRMKALRSRGA